MNAAGPAVRVRGLRKAYGEKVVLDGIDLDIADGTVFALLGPNGAGKTTTVQILSTLIDADAGEVHIGGFDLGSEPRAVRRAIGVTGQFSAVDYLLTGRENLLLMADLHHLDRSSGRPRVTELLERFDLVDAAGQMVMKYSGGMRRRLDLAMTLIGDPRIIFLDEPTTGLDPRSRHTMWQITRDLVAGGVTVLLTTQNLDEADQLAARIAVLDRGHIVAEGTPDDLKRGIAGGRARLHFGDLGALTDAERVLAKGASDVRALVLDVPTDATPQSLRAILDALDAHAVPVDSVTVHTADLDDVFFALTGTSPHTKEVPA
ncbi:MAG: ATP-binding cassette domain-containing protein [Candidatus Dormibacter sp.]